MRPVWVFGCHNNTDQALNDGRSVRLGLRSIPSMMQVLKTRFARLVTGALLTLAVVAVTPTAYSQFGEAAGIAEAMVPEYLSRDVRLFQEGLDLDDTQRVILEALFNDYEDSFNTGLDRMKQRFEEMRPEFESLDERRVLALVFLPFEDWSKEKAEIGVEFIENVKVLLTPQQMELWPAFDRRLLREKELHKGRLAGESTDLLAIIRDMKLDETTLRAIQPVLDEYDISLDAALRARKASMTGTSGDMLRSLADQDTQKSLAVLDRQIDTRVRIRNVNDEYTRRIAEALPADAGQRFLSTALDRSYPRVYRETPVDRLFRAALELDEIDPSVRDSISTIYGSYTSALAAMNEDLLASLRDFEPKEQRLRAEAFAARMGGGDAKPIEDPTRESFSKRDELGRNFAKQLQAALPPELFARLPGAGRFMASAETQNAPMIPKAVPMPPGSKKARTPQSSSDEALSPALPK
jgi:hypothetical protein